MDARHVLLLGIVLNISAGIGALGFALLEDRIGSRATILIAVLSLCLCGIMALLSPSPKLFWAAAIGLGVFVGPAQSASRSLMAQLADLPSRNAMFGLYALSGRITGFIGPAVLGAVTSLTGSQRAGMGAIVVLLATGGLILALTPPRPG
jgi:MFS transporter, UMF1 family